MLKNSGATNPTFLPMITKYFRKSFYSSLLLFWLRMLSHISYHFLRPTHDLFIFLNEESSAGLFSFSYQQPPFLTR
ncbi:hypothetical protein EMIT0P176_420039 [Pseudomonas sp. IT-P176]